MVREVQIAREREHLERSDTSRLPVPFQCNGLGYKKMIPGLLSRFTWMAGIRLVRLALLSDARDYGSFLTEQQESYTCRYIDQDDGGKQYKFKMDYLCFFRKQGCRK